MRWTLADIADQRGRVALVTGGTGGLGYVTARELARAGAEVLLAGRDKDRGEEAVTRVREAAPEARLRWLPLDLADLGSVRECAAEFAGRYEGLDLLVNNAGVMALPYRRTADGFEMQLGTNHLGHFALTGLLLPSLSRRPDPAVVTVSSNLHRRGKIDFADLQGERRYGRWMAYSQSKLANLLFAYELARRAEAAGSPLRSIAAHPGYAATNLQLAGPRMAGSGTMERTSRVMNHLFAQDAERGARSILYAATAPDLRSGGFVGPDGPFEMRGDPKIADSSPASKDETTARRLWDASARLTGVSFDFGSA